MQNNLETSSFHVEQSCKVKPSMLTPKELCERIKVAPDTLSKWRTMRRNGDKIGPPFVVLGGGDPRGGGIRYRIADVLEWEASLTDGEAA